MAGLAELDGRNRTLLALLAAIGIASSREVFLALAELLKVCST
ncbi:MAG: hypothetical protein QME60_08980 [Verrucomicrobiota bacterium]|nr:hypothetical protein [Verrucomicrobiota bacterium]